MNNEAIQGIKDLIYPILPKLYAGVAIIAGIALILSIIIILVKNKK